MPWPHTPSRRSPSASHTPDLHRVTKLCMNTIGNANHLPVRHTVTSEVDALRVTATESGLAKGAKLHGVERQSISASRHRGHFKSRRSVFYLQIQNPVTLYIAAFGQLIKPVGKRLLLPAAS